MLLQKFLCKRMISIPWTRTSEPLCCYTDGRDGGLSSRLRANVAVWRKTGVRETAMNWTRSDDRLLFARQLHPFNYYLPQNDPEHEFFLELRIQRLIQQGTLVEVSASYLYQPLQTWTEEEVRQVETHNRSAPRQQRLQLNLKKCHLSPVQQLDHLGMTVAYWNLWRQCWNQKCQTDVNLCFKTMGRRGRTGRRGGGERDFWKFCSKITFPVKTYCIW